MLHARQAVHGYTQEELDIVATWFTRGLPLMDGKLPEDPRPSECLPGVSAEVGAHVAELATTGQCAYHQELLRVEDGYYRKLYELQYKEQEQKAFAAVAAFSAPYSMRMIEIDTVGMYDTAAEEMGKVFVLLNSGAGALRGGADAEAPRQSVRCGPTDGNMVEVEGGCLLGRRRTHLCPAR